MSAGVARKPGVNESNNEEVKMKAINVICVAAWRNDNQ